MIDYLLNWTDDPLGNAHLGAALTALFVGAFVILLRKARAFMSPAAMFMSSPCWA